MSTAATKQPMIDRMKVVYEKAFNVEKKGYNKHADYAFATVDDVKAAVNVAFRSAGLFVKQSHMELLQQTPYTKNADGTKTPGRAVVKLRMVVTDGSEELELDGLGEGMDTGDKAIFKAIAGAIKYALTVGLLIATGDRDDPEATEPEGKPEPAAAPKTTPKAPKKSEPAAAPTAPGPDAGEMLDEIRVMTTLGDLEALKPRLKKLHEKITAAQWAPVIAAFTTRRDELTPKAQE